MPENEMEHKEKSVFTTILIICMKEAKNQITKNKAKLRKFRLNYYLNNSWL